MPTPTTRSGLEPEPGLPGTAAAFLWAALLLADVMGGTPTQNTTSRSTYEIGNSHNIENSENRSQNVNEEAYGALADMRIETLDYDSEMSPAISPVETPASVKVPTRIINGEDAKISDFPYQVALETSRSRAFCGGSIISAEWVLTAAHCVASAWKLRAEMYVRVGATIREKGGKRVAVRKKIAHPQYTPSAMRVGGPDVGLLKLADRLEFTATVKPIALSPSGSPDPPSGKEMTITGWGVLKYGTHQLPRVLQKAKVPVIDREKCSAIYEKVPGGQLVRSSEICAGGNRKDTCQGDSGGPMVDSSGVQVGITSWGIRCADYPGVYSKVGDPDLRSFIAKIAGV